MSDYQHPDHAPMLAADADGAAWCEVDRRPSPAHAAIAGCTFDLASLVQALPKLGAVLWLDRRVRRSVATHAISSARGVLPFDHPALAALKDCGAVTAHAAVTPQGPREWLCFLDAVGVPQGKMFLLPDTDYLAWDEMTATCRPLPPSPATSDWHPHAAFLRTVFARLGCHWRARLLTFELRQLPWLHMLGARAPLRISLIGLELAHAIARTENAKLISPLHGGT
ncbi:MAG: hypothetical protein ABIW82_11960 [Dokdonella sp.]